MDVDTAMKTALLARLIVAPSLPLFHPLPLPSLRDPVTRGRSLRGVRPRGRHARGCRGLAVLLGACVGRVPLRVCARGSESKGARGVTLGALWPDAPPRDYPVCISCVRSSSIGALTSQHKTMHYTFWQNAPLPAKALFVSALVAKPTEAVHETGETRDVHDPRLVWVCVYIYIYINNMQCNGCRVGIGDGSGYDD
ncbi:hypothetical protein TcYC6_0175280 [Trypanosoma cruzi]|nr:hypothetical protein TcYC6_0175280 [Trypanosoma cruzi]